MSGSRSSLFTNALAYIRVFVCVRARTKYVFMLRTDYVCVYMYVCMYVHVYMYMYVCMYVCMHVCVYVCVCMYVCVCV